MTLIRSYYLPIKVWLNYFTTLIHAEKTRWFILFYLRNFFVNICGKERSKESFYGGCIQCLRIRDSGWHYYDPRWNRGLWGSIGIESPLGGDTIFCLFRRLRGSPFQKVRQTPSFTLGHSCITPKGWAFLIRRRIIRSSLFLIVLLWSTPSIEFIVFY